MILHIPKKEGYGSNVLSTVLQESNHTVQYTKIDSTDLIYNAINEKLETKDTMETMHKIFDLWQGGLKTKISTTNPINIFYYTIDVNWE